MTDNKEVTYFSESRNEYIPVSSMVDQHVRNAFTKMLREEGSVGVSRHEAERAFNQVKDLYKFFSDLKNGSK